MDKYLIRKDKDGDKKPSGSEQKRERVVFEDGSNKANEGNQSLKRQKILAAPNDVGTDSPVPVPDLGNRLAIWLNSLILTEAQGLWEVLRSLYPIIPRHFIDDSVGDIRSLTNSLEAERDGKWYVEVWLTCEIIDLDKGTPIGHPKWQLDLNASQGMTLRVQKVLSAGAWTSLQQFYPPAKRRQAKLMAHHVSYNALSLRDRAPIPLNCGSGGSISHFCDQRGCVKQSHLEATPHHVKNMDRQRCSGVRLVVYLGVIVQELPCPHGTEAVDMAGQLLHSCRRLSLVQLTADTLVRVQAVAQKNSKITIGEN